MEIGGFVPRSSRKEDAMQVQPYLFMDGRCEEALDFYKKTLGAQVDMLMRFKEAPPSPDNPGAGCGAPGSEDKILHSSFRIGDTTIMASDGMNNGKPEFKGFSLSLNAKDEAEAERLFKALSDGGRIEMPLAKTFFSSAFGMVADKFGVGWMVIVAP
jgi:PhnB protein